MLTKKEAATCCAMLRRIVYRDGSCLSISDMHRIRGIMEAQNIAGMADCADDPELLPVQNRENALVYATYHHILRETVCRLFQEMEKRGIKGAALKGEAVSDCYPPDVIRASGDIDLYLPGKQREAFALLMKDMGFRLHEDAFEGQPGVDDYYSPEGIHMEAHVVYFQRLSAWQRKLLKERGFFSTALFEQADGYVALKPEAHLLYMIYHADKHLIGHGVTMRMLMDIAQFVNRHAGEIDPAAFQAFIRQLKITRPTNAIFCYCEKYLGMRKGFWRKTGPRMEFFVRLMMTPTDEELQYRNWERFLRRPHPYFYLDRCEEAEQEYRVRHIYSPNNLLKKKYNISTFVFWCLIRLVWGFDVDHSNEAV